MKSTVILAILVTFVGRIHGNADWTWDDETFLDRFVNDRTGFNPGDFITPLAYYNNTAVGCHTYILNFTSGPWMGDYSDQPVWWHYLAINIPLEDNIQTTDHAMLFIDGGSNGGPPDGSDDFVVALCIVSKDTGAISGVLKQIPNQRITFTDDPFQDDRSEDDLIAYTWADFIRQHENTADYVEADYERILQFPMARGSVRALDVMNAFTLDFSGGAWNLTNFGVAGGSKRGWASWLVALLDRRINFAAPIVISILNVTQNLHHHYENLGAWTFAFGDYWMKNITGYIDDPRTQLIMDQIDPYSYRQRLTMTKMIVCGSSDEFFQPDDTYDFYSDLPEPKYMFMVENAEHAMVGSYTRVLKNMGTVFYSLFTGFPIPQMTWRMGVTGDSEQTGGTLRVTTNTVPTAYAAWMADSVAEGGRRDFRIIALDGLQYVYWNVSEEAEWTVIDDFNYEVYFPVSTTSPYRGFLVNMFFPGPAPFHPIELTTEVNIIPQARPFPPCQGAGCQGTLI